MIRSNLVWYIIYFIVAFQSYHAVYVLLGDGILVTIFGIILSIALGWVVADAVEHAEKARQGSLR